MEISKIEAQFQGFDIAFFPVDPRMQKDYYEGALMFLERFNVTHFFPMHFGIRINVAKNFKNKYKTSYNGDTIIYTPENQGHKFKIEI
jgi:L-ascorbate metabolism protein UlaG (beta-lactamase superfamily)